MQTAAVPPLAAWIARFAAAPGLCQPLPEAGHDIGGAIAQHLLIGQTRRSSGWHW